LAFTVLAFGVRVFTVRRSSLRLQASRLGLLGLEEAKRRLAFVPPNAEPNFCVFFRIDPDLMRGRELVQ
jgi:hypothetical protein